MVYTVKELIDQIPWKGFREGLLYGLSEAESLGKNFIGLTLAQGDGLILYVNPYFDEVYDILVFTPNKLNKGEFFGIFKYEKSGKAYNLYKLINLKDLLELYGIDNEIVYVEVIQDVLEDFLSEVLGR